MKFAAVAIFAAAAVSADVVFKVSNFEAGCIAHSSQCRYAFGVLQPGTMETNPVQCTALVTGGSDGTLPAVTDGTCENSSRTFTVAKSADGLTLTVSQPVSRSSQVTGSHLIPVSDLKMNTEPNAVVQTYAGPIIFDLE